MVYLTAVAHGGSKKKWNSGLRGIATFPVAEEGLETFTVTCKELPQKPKSIQPTPGIANKKIKYSRSVERI